MSHSDKNLLLVETREFNFIVKVTSVNQINEETAQKYLEDIFTANTTRAMYAEVVDCTEGQTGKED